MRIYEPVAISLFTVIVLAACFMMGKSIGYKEGIIQAQHHKPNLVESQYTNSHPDS